MRGYKYFPVKANFFCLPLVAETGNNSSLDLVRERTKPTEEPPLVSLSKFQATDNRAGFNSRRYQILWEVMGLERGPLSLVSTTEDLTEWYV
jgi:hypothetical protein